MIEVGDNQKVVVTEENHELFLKGREIFDSEENVISMHMGWVGLSSFVNYVLENYEKKNKEIKK